MLAAWPPRWVVVLVLVLVLLVVVVVAGPVVGGGGGGWWVFVRKVSIVSKALGCTVRRPQEGSMARAL